VSEIKTPAIRTISERLDFLNAQRALLQQLVFKRQINLLMERSQDAASASNSLL
jgi:hypothetical protein